MKFLSSRWVILILTLIVTSFLLVISNMPQWKYHLESDTRGFYYPRFVYFLNNYSFGDYQSNEYFPGAMFFFLVPGISALFFGNTYGTYLAGLFFVNIVLIFLHVVIYSGKDKLSAYTFLAILLLSGPLFLFRHDFFVTLFVLFSILTFNIRKTKTSFFLLGIATTIKIYPVLLLPYYLLVAKKKNGFGESVTGLTIYFSGFLLVVGMYFFFSSGVKDLMLPLTINSIKPVHVESVWGSLLTIYSKLANGYYAPGLGANGLFGIHPSFIYLPLSFYNYFWIAPLLIMYLLSSRILRGGKLSIEFIFLIILGFEIFSKILTGQYLYWFLALAPLISFRHQDTNPEKMQKAVFVILVLTATFLTQYIYPLHYNELLGAFYSNGSMPIYFYLLLTRNLILIAIFIQVAYLVFNEKYHVEKN